MPFGQRHVAINIYDICKGHFGSRGETSKNKLEDTSFIFPMTNVTILGVFRTNAQTEYGKVLKWKILVQNSSVSIIRNLKKQNL